VEPSEGSAMKLEARPTVNKKNENSSGSGNQFEKKHEKNADRSKPNLVDK
jgi:hypothetical protein